MIRAARHLAAAVVFAVALGAPAGAETLFTALSHDRISISSNFTGTQVVVFGTIERDAQTVARSGNYDVVVTVSGPETTVVTRRKERIAGVWINHGSEVVQNVPSFLAIHATRPLEEIAVDTLRARIGLGLDMLPINAEPSPVPPVRTDYETSFLRLMQEEHRYVQVEDGVEFLGAQLFRATVSLPATVSVGTYTATVRLFRDGALLATKSGPLSIGKVGFEAHVSEFSRDYGLLYGIATVLIAVVTGWLAGVIFRKD